MTAESITDSPYCLVVDDEPRLRQVLVHLMKTEGFTCMEAANGEEALVLLQRHPMTLVISDLRMPKMDGLELLRQTRARWPDVAVMMITAVADVEVAVSCLAIGAMDYLTKPFHHEEVRARVAQAIENRRLVLENRGYQRSLQEKVAVQARRLEELFMTSIQSLAEVLELKDPYTRGHSVRVSMYSAVIARELGVDGEMLRQVELGGHVHDIGKIGVREDVLNKPGKLTDLEYEHIMTHPVVGWRILAPLLAETPVALNIVRSHHERFDGHGVPDHLIGAAIPLEARIAAAADAFDAMTSNRPYRPDGLSVADAIKDLHRCSGTQFDPDIVVALARASDAGRLTVVRRSTAPYGMPVIQRGAPAPSRITA